MAMRYEGAAAEALDPGRAPGHRGGAYAGTGLLLLAYGGGAIAWIARGFWTVQTGGVDFLRALGDPTVHVSGQHLGPYEWVLAVALVVTALLAFRRRRVARGAALVLASLVLLLAVRDGVGCAVSSAYRDAFTDGRDGQWALAMRGAGALAGLVVALLMARADDGRDRRTAVRGGGRGAFVAAGLLLLAWAGVLIAWRAYELSRADGGTADYLRFLGDASRGAGPTRLATEPLVYEAALILVLAAAGAVLLARRRAARGAGLLLALVTLYLAGRDAVAMGVRGDWDAYVDGTEHTLRTVTTAGGIVLALLVLACMLRASDTRAQAAAAVSATVAAGLAPSPGPSQGPSQGPSLGSARLVAAPAAEADKPAETEATSAETEADDEDAALEDAPHEDAPHEDAPHEDAPREDAPEAAPDGEPAPEEPAEPPVPDRDLDPVHGSTDEPASAAKGAEPTGPSPEHAVTLEEEPEPAPEAEAERSSEPDRGEAQRNA